MVFYLDTSALLKRYVQEVGAAWLATFYRPDANHIFEVPWTYIPLRRSASIASGAA
jgi:hypothetical protein